MTSTGSAARIERRFGADIPKLLRIFSSDLYPDPAVFLRELLANCYDAVLRREAREHHFGSRTAVLVETGRDGVLAVSDEGIGMTENELVEFLSNLGHSSAEESQAKGTPCIGRFGVGFLSVFAVAEQLEVDSQSAVDPGAGSRLWCWNHEDRYQILQGRRQHTGTTVRIQFRKEFRHFADSNFVCSEIRKRVPFLDIPIHVDSSGDPRGDVFVPGRVRPVEDWFRRTDWPTSLPVRDTPVLHFFSTGLNSGGGVAFAFPATPMQVRSVSVYMKGILVAEYSEGFMPPGWGWVDGLVNLAEGRLTLDRSEVQNHPNMDTQREEIEAVLSEELVWLAVAIPDRFRAIASVHRGHIHSLLVQSRRLVEKIGRQLPFDTTLGEMTFDQMVASCTEGSATTKIYYLDQTPLADPRWSMARADGRVVVWCRDAAEVAALKALVTNSPGTELLRLGWGDAEGIPQVVPLTTEMQRRFAALRNYLAPENIYVEPADIRPVSVIGAVELSTNSAPATMDVDGNHTGLLDILTRVMANLRGPETPDRLHGRLLLNVTNSELQELLALTENGSLEVAAALLFLVAVTKTGIPLPAEWQSVLGRLVDKAVKSAAGSGRDPGLDDSAHTICFFAHQFNRDKEVLSAIRGVLEHAPFYWEVRSADEATKDPQLFENVLTQVKLSQIIIAEITEGNPNVMLETGLAYGLSGGRPVVLLSDPACQKKISDLQSHLLFPYEGTRLAMGRREFQDRFRSWVMQQDRLARFLRRRPFLGYRLLQEAGLMDANMGVAFLSLFPDAYRFATSSAKVISEKTNISEARIAQMQDIFRGRLQDSNETALRF